MPILGRLVSERDYLRSRLDKARSERDKLRLKLETAHANKELLTFPPGHFYSPIVNPVEIADAFRARALQPVQTLPGISISLTAHTAHWSRLLPFLQEIPFPEETTEGFRYYFRNSAYSYGDASILYAMLRLYRPTRVIEVGSGYSSACTMDTIDHYLKGRVDVTFVEPYPDLLREVIGTQTMQRVRLYDKCVQEVPLTVFAELKSGDILFIDSTHIMKTGSDVCYELFEILPRLAPGVLIHFHDIFWPFEYTDDWESNVSRSWNEMYGIHAFLMYNGDFEIVFFNDFFRRFRRDLIEDSYPAFLKNTGGALWLRKV